MLLSDEVYHNQHLKLLSLHTLTLHTVTHTHTLHTVSSHTLSTLSLHTHTLHTVSSHTHSPHCLFTHSLSTLSAVCLPTQSISGFLTGLEASGWMKHIHLILETSLFIATVISLVKRGGRQLEISTSFSFLPSHSSPLSLLPLPPPPPLLPVSSPSLLFLPFSPPPVLFRHYMMKV